MSKNMKELTMTDEEKMKKIVKDIVSNMEKSGAIKDDSQRIAITLQGVSIKIDGCEDVATTYMLATLGAAVLGASIEDRQEFLDTMGEAYDLSTKTY